MREENHPENVNDESEPATSNLKSAPLPSTSTELANFNKQAQSSLPNIYATKA